MEILQVHNPSGLPTMPYTDFKEFQGDLKLPIEPENLARLRESLKKHGVFVPKFVWIDEGGQPNILDGHQTRQALASLEQDGWQIPDIPYAVIDADNRADAAEKLLQLNSRYAQINEHTTWFDELELADLPELLQAVAIPELDEFVREVATVDWDQALEKVPQEDRLPIKRLTFTLHDSQVEMVETAIKKAKAEGIEFFAASENDNSNGNALAYICERYGQG
jgi:hypothetical protein